MICSRASQKLDRAISERCCRSADGQSISICPNRRGPSESLVLVVVLVLVIGNWAVEDEDEKEDGDDLVAAPLDSAVSQISNLLAPGRSKSRRIPMPRRSPTPCRLQVGDTAQRGEAATKMIQPRMNTDAHG
jgi:hypothetical protein